MGIDRLLSFSASKNKTIKRALTHKSFNNTHNNERLEFLGDTILGSIVSEYFFLKNKKSNEGELSKKRDLVVSRKNLNQIGEEIFKEIDLKHRTNKVSKNMYGDFLEALIGAIYLERGYVETQKFVFEQIIKRHKKTGDLKKDYKGKLMFIANKENKKINFVRIEHKGPDHKRKHKIGLSLDGKIIMTLWSKTIKEGEHELSKRAFKKLYENNTHPRGSV